MIDRAAAFARRSSAPAVLALALLALPAFFAGRAHGQQAGDRVVITMKSGKKYTVELVSKGESEVKFKLGSSEMAVPASMVASIEAVDSGGGSGGHTPAPAPEPAPAPSGGGTEAGPPKPSTITMKDGTVLTGFIVGKADGKVWIVEGEPRALGESFVAKVEGGSGGGGGASAGASTTTGSLAERSRALVQELGCGEEARELAAYSGLEALGPTVIGDAVVAGFSDSNPKIRKMCMTLAGRVRQENALKKLYEVLDKDEVMEVRKAAAETLGSWPAEGASEALLHSAAWDRSAEVRIAALSSLARYASPEMAKQLVDMLAEFPDDSPAVPALCGALRRATGKDTFTSNERAAWVRWWNEQGGKQEIDDVIAERKRKETFKEGEGEGEK